VLLAAERAAQRLGMADAGSGEVFGSAQTLTRSQRAVGHGLEISGVDHAVAVGEDVPGGPGFFELGPLRRQRCSQINGCVGGEEIGEVVEPLEDLSLSFDEVGGVRNEGVEAALGRGLDDADDVFDGVDEGPIEDTGLLEPPARLVRQIAEGVEPDGLGGERVERGGEGSRRPQTGQNLCSPKTA
jgi:hypothetical protein